MRMKRMHEEEDEMEEDKDIVDFKQKRAPY